MRSRMSKRVVKGRAAGIILEDIDAKLDMIVEKVEVSERRLEEKIEEFRQEVRGEFAGDHAILRLHGEQLEKHEEKMRQHDREITSLKELPRHEFSKGIQKENCRLLRRNGRWQDGGGVGDRP